MAYVVLQPHSLSNPTDKYRVAEFREVVDGGHIACPYIAQYATYPEAEAARDAHNEHYPIESAGTVLLDLPLGENDAEAATVKDYLKALLAELWREGEGFSGKRPFGNSGWEYELYLPMIKAGLISGKLEEGGYGVEEVDAAAAHQLIQEAIAKL
jgi:hypothetical protein